ncbi:MAG: ROK family protein [Kiritimatiellales bacterium]|jgi:predicted NBD/HSP70 family sugar kinase
MTRILPSYIKNHLSLESLNSSRPLLQWIEKEGAVTQTNAAKAVRLSGGTCNLHFQKLEHMKLIHRVDTVNQGRGRSTIIWELEQGKNFCLSLVFDVPFFQAALVDFSGRVLMEQREDMTGLAGRKALERQLDKVVKAALACAHKAGGHIRQAFVGVPGILDPVSSVVVNAANFPVLNGMDFKTRMQDRHGIPCYCGSLGLAFYYGEIESLPPDARALVIYWDLGVGAAAGVGERVVSHHHSDLLLSEFSHVRIERDGRLCHCGRRGCLEAYVGGLAMLEALDSPDVKSLDQFMKAVLAGNADSVRVANDAAYRLGRNLCWVQQVMQSERLILSGPLSVIFPVVRPAFIKGLSEMFNEAEIAALNPEASGDAQAAMRRGAFRLARRLFFYPE